MKKHTWKIVFVVAALLMGASFLYAHYVSSKANEGVVISDHFKGNESAAVTLTEYADFQCPACGQFYPIMKEVETQYGDKLRIEFKHFPLMTIHPFALPAAKAAEAAGQQGQFWQMHDKLFENQNTWSRSAAPQAYFIQYAEELGLDMPLFKKHLRSSLLQDHIESQFNEAQDLGLTGTPSFYLNGERLEFQTFEEFFGAIDAALGIAPQDAAQTVASSSENGVEFGI